MTILFYRSVTWSVSIIRRRSRDENVPQPLEGTSYAFPVLTLPMLVGRKALTPADRTFKTCQVARVLDTAALPSNNMFHIRISETWNVTQALRDGRLVRILLCCKGCAVSELEGFVRAKGRGTNKRYTCHNVKLTAQLHTETLAQISKRKNGDSSAPNNAL